MMRILLALVVAVIAGAAGFGGGWWYFTQHRPPGGEAAEAAEAPPLPPVNPTFVNIGPFTVPVLGSERISQFVTLVVAVEVDGLSTAERVRAIGPRLTDAYLTTLYGAIEGGAILQGGVVDISQLKSKLVQASEGVLGPGIARDVLVQVVSQRPM